MSSWTYCLRSTVELLMAHKMRWVFMAKGEAVWDTWSRRKERKQRKSLSHVQLFVTPWTIAWQAPLSMGFPGKNTRVGCHALLQGIFPTQELNLYLLHWQVDSLTPMPPGLPGRKWSLQKFSSAILSYQLPRFKLTSRQRDELWKSHSLPRFKGTKITTKKWDSFFRLPEEEVNNLWLRGISFS